MCDGIRQQQQKLYSVNDYISQKCMNSRTFLFLKYYDCMLIIFMSSRYYWEANFESFTVATMTCLTVTNDHGYVPLDVNTSRSN
jgi:hypothetical protein